MPNNLEYDVFVSHNRLDKPWVRTFVQFLRKQKMRVFFDEDSIDYGADVVTSIDTAIERSTHVLLFITPNSMRSKWVALESSVSIYSDPSAQARKIIPIILMPVPSEQITASIRRLNRVDLTKSDQREPALRKLLRELGVNDDRLPLPGWPDHAGDEAEEKPSETVYRFRQPAQDWYIERKEQQFVREVLSDESGGSHKNILVTGRTGFGKSSLLAWLLRETRDRDCNVITISPMSDRLSDFLLLFSQHARDQLESLDLTVPRLKGIPKLDIDALLSQLLTKTKKRLVIVVDQVERLFPYAASVTAGAIWRALTENFLSHFRQPRILWVIAVKEWYFLSLFPSELDLRLINFTYIALGDLGHEQARQLIERLASLTNTKIDNNASDLFVAKAGGRPLTIVLAFLVALERTPKALTLDYDYLNATEPWNEIFEAEYSFLESHRQRLIVLAIAHSHRELVPQEEVFRKVAQTDGCSRSDVEADLKRIDHDFGLLVTNEGFVAFVHSGFGVYIDSKHSNEYPPIWGNAGPSDADDKQRRDLEATSTDAAQRVIAVLAHSLKTRFAHLSVLDFRLREALREKDMVAAGQLSQEMVEAHQLIAEVLTRASSAFGSVYVETGETVVLADAIKQVINGIPKEMIVVDYIFVGDLRQVRVLGSKDIIESVFAELFNNAIAAGSTAARATRIRVRVELEKDSRLVVCNVEDNGPGVPQSQKDRIFGAFYSHRPGSRSGLGLGLTFVRRAVEACGGMISEIGAPESGAHFLLKFVVADNPGSS